MKRKNGKKLILNRDRLRKISNENLNAVVGGAYTVYEGCAPGSADSNVQPCTTVRTLCAY